ncbi:phage minor head protein [Xylophilus sp. GOD-11R]|uniref:phage minor head protein n=1 Tax=Xylophilus sp. GOD-11R TaxID=3089814 RepID=UPI00298BD4D5|nr:phage minor head protein [Xylophilus sp. GOD-11R]WPB58629.1 phage minor head protein [Xylophilus sp. GOD-11R]
MIERPRNPVIPGNSRDRTGSAGILRRGNAEISRRWRSLQADVLAAFDRLPVYQLNEDDKGSDTPIPVRYGVTPQVLDQATSDLQAALDRWILDGRQADHVAWWDVYEQEAAQLGTAQSVANLSNLSAAYASTRTLQTVVFSEPYRQRAQMARTLSREYWTGLADESRAKLSSIIGRAVIDGKNPKVVRKEIMEALGVSKSRATLYAQTDITGTLREARWAEADAAEAELGVRTALLWTSALIATTRPWHASRNGQSYSTEQVRAFYATNGNRFRCHCAQTECLLDAQGKPILTKALQSAMANERRVWFE